MGGLFFSPKPPVFPAPAAPAVEDDSQEEEERRRRLDMMERRRRGRGATIATSPRGLLVLEDWVPRRKSLLGE